MADEFEAPEQPSLSDALGDAVDEVVDGDEENYPEEPEGTEEEGEAAPDQQTAEEFIENATAAELEQIKRDPVLSKLYNSMLRDYKHKTTSVAAERKAAQEEAARVAAESESLQQARELFEAIKEDPDQVIRAMAQRRGLTIAEAKAELQGADDDEVVKLFGDDAETIRPVLSSLIDKRVNEKVGPIADRLMREDQERLSREVGNEISNFQAEMARKGDPITPEIERKMQEVSEKIDPGKGVTTGEYLRMLHAIASAGKTKAAVAREIVNRQKQSSGGGSPREVPSTGSTPGSAITKDMRLGEAIETAFDQVQAGR